MLRYVLSKTIKSAMVRTRLRLGLYATLALLLSSFPSRVQDMNKPLGSQTSMAGQCMNNLRHIYRLLKLHLHHSAGAMGFPPNFDLLYGMSKDPKVFICPADKQINPSVKTDTFRTSYEVVNDPLKPKLSTIAPSRVAIVAETRPNHDGQRFVLFYDGSVRAFDKAEFDKLKADGFIDNPTR